MAVAYESLLQTLDAIHSDSEVGVGAVDHAVAGKAKARSSREPGVGKGMSWEDKSDTRVIIALRLSLTE